MPDFSKLLSAPAGSAVRPVALPAGDYPGMIRGHEVGESQQKKTPYVRINVGLTDWPEGAEPMEGVDLSKKQLRREYYLTDEAKFRLDDLLASCGVHLDGAKSYNEALLELHGQPVMVAVTQRTIERDGTADVVNDVARLAGLG